MSNETTKYTPGPWKYERRGFVWVVESPIVPVVARLTADPEDAEAVAATDADARLISAAPEMAGAIAAFLADVDAVKVGAGERFHLKTSHVRAFRAAINKATGEEGER